MGDHDELRPGRARPAARAPLSSVALAVDRVAPARREALHDPGRRARPGSRAATCRASGLVAARARPRGRGERGQAREVLRRRARPSKASGASVVRRGARAGSRARRRTTITASRTGTQRAPGRSADRACGPRSVDPLPSDQPMLDRRAAHPARRRRAVDPDAARRIPLRKDGYEVVQAIDGREALARFAESRLRPRRARRDDAAARRARGVPAPAGRAARCRSSCSRPRPRRSTRSLGLELGADDYITKPFSLREFRSRVKAALRRAGMARARRRPTSEPLEVARAAHRPGQALGRASAARSVAHDLRRVRDPARAGHAARAAS